MQWEKNARIVGGEEADIREAPYQVALLKLLPGGIYFQMCGGSIRFPRVIITAAHCVSQSNPSDWRIRAGSASSSSGGQLIPVERFIVHERYGGIDYDIALIVLSSNIMIDGLTTRTILIPGQDSPTIGGMRAFVTGWGSTDYGGATVDKLRKVTIPVVDQDKCIEAYGGPTMVTPRMLCAGNLNVGGQDACQGDSGGPLTIDGVLYGITSWGIGCGDPKYPGVWARVPAFSTWIESQDVPIES